MPVIQDASPLMSALRNQLPVPDVEFDRLFPAADRVRSTFHWTPVDVALRASALLAPSPGMRVLDVGSGVGKLCLIGALATPGAWVGVELDTQMIRAGRVAARRLHVENRVEFVHGDATRIDWTPFDAIYLFNPFAEALLTKGGNAMERREQYVDCVERTQEQLSTTRPGTRIVTYHGFGGDMPLDAELVHREPAREDELCLWIRRPTVRIRRSTIS